MNYHSLVIDTLPRKLQNIRQRDRTVLYGKYRLPETRLEGKFCERIEKEDGIDKS